MALRQSQTKPNRGDSEKKNDSKRPLPTGKQMSNEPDFRANKQPKKEEDWQKIQTARKIDGKNNTQPLHHLHTPQSPVPQNQCVL